MLVLYGMPRLLTGSIIAHELMVRTIRFFRCSGARPPERRDAIPPGPPADGSASSESERGASRTSPPNRLTHSLAQSLNRSRTHARRRPAQHVYLRANRYPRLCPKVEEGLCQLLAFMWLRPAIETGACAADRECGEYFSHQVLALHPSLPPSLTPSLAHSLAPSLAPSQIMHNTTETYGDGFREALLCYETVGLAALLDHVRTHQRLPLS